MQRHPTKHELLAYTESLISGRSISAQLGGHVSRCPVCSQEVQAMRQTLRIASAAAALAPSRDFTAQVLLAAKNARGIETKRRRRHRSVLAVTRGFGYAAALVVVSTVWFGAASESPSAPEPAAAPAAPEAVAVGPSLEELRRTAEEIRILAAAVKAASGTENAHALQQRRLATALDAELNEALAALEQNPGCTRASAVVQANLRRKAEALKELYLSQSSS